MVWNKNVERIRAALPRFLLDRVTQFEPEARNAVLDAVPPSTLDTIRQTLPIGWMKMGTHMEFCGRVCDVVGEPRYRALWADITTQFCKRPLLKGLISMGQRLYGQTPSAAVRQFPRMYDVGTERLGKLGVHERSAEEFSIRLDGFPAERYDFDNYVSGLRGAAQGLSEHMFPEKRTRVDIDNVDPTLGSVVYRYTLEST